MHHPGTPDMQSNTCSLPRHLANPSDICRCNSRPPYMSQLSRNRLRLLRHSPRLLRLSSCPASLDCYCRHSRSRYLWCSTWMAPDYHHNCQQAPRKPARIAARHVRGRGAWGTGIESVKSRQHSPSSRLRRATPDCVGSTDHAVRTVSDRADALDVLPSGTHALKIAIIKIGALIRCVRA